MSQIPVKDVTPKKSNDLYQKREKIYVREVEGFFQKLRSYSLWFLMLSYFGTAWLSWGDRQAVFFDLPARQFHIFGLTFWPQDFVLLAVALIICAYGLFTITNLAGRIWCGYTCPQTAWSFIFMWIEEKAEGTRNQRIKLDKAPMSAEKFRKKALKHLGWLFIAFATGLTFVGYFSPIRELVPNLLSWSALNQWELFWMGFFTVATYVNAGWMREQVCIYMCPYARFQSVMYDSDTYAVSYDEARGEPRGKRKKNIDYKEQGKGACVDCNLCVQVCPTGIDIRDGMQYQCIGCALCIDACDGIMDQMGYDRGLIRYATEHELNGGKTHLIRPRSVGYTVMLLAMMIGLAYSLINRTPFELDIIRDRGALYVVTPNDTVENSYTLKVMNMTQQPQTYSLAIDGITVKETDLPNEIKLDINKLITIPVTIEASPDNLTATKTNFEFVVTNQDGDVEVAREESRFIAPRNL